MHSTTHAHNALSAMTVLETNYHLICIGTVGALLAGGPRILVLHHPNHLVLVWLVVEVPTLVTPGIWAISIDAQSLRARSDYDACSAG
eukprot:SAG11_NODE_100_length_16863_cov_12.374911_13_plen_88_part_00